MLRQRPFPCARKEGSRGELVRKELFFKEEDGETQQPIKPLCDKKEDLKKEKKIVTQSKGDVCSKSLRGKGGKGRDQQSTERENISE